MNKHLLFALLSLCIGISLSGIAAYYSVIGLSKIFAGASFQVILMASFMEAGKILVATLLHNYWNELKVKIKVYLALSVMILMVITSAGIYGLLSSAYQESYSGEKILNRNISLIEIKIQNFNEIKKDLSVEKEKISDDISSLRSSLGNNVIKYTDRETGEEVITTSSSNRKVYVKELNEASQRRDQINNKLISVNDSIGKWEIEKIELENSSDLSSELLPLKYISKISGWEMDYVVNIFLLLLIIVFDPLAIALIISANILFVMSNKKTKTIINDKVSIEPTDNDNGIYEIDEDENITDHFEDEIIEDQVNGDEEEDILSKYSEELENLRERGTSNRRGLTKNQVKNMSHQEAERYLKGE